MDDDYDVFVSHSSKDTPAVRKLVELWQSWGHKVFADFLDEKLLEASKNDRVDAALSEHLRNVIRHCRVFVFVASENSIKSGWMPWELGLAHGAVGRVHIYRLDDTDLTKIAGREYLALYQGKRFSDKDAEAYLQRVVSQAKSEASNAAQIEAALDMGRRALEAALQGRSAEVGKQLSKAPLEQGRATAAGMSAADLWPFAWWLVPYKK
jgi:hypothetical protein